MNRHIPSPQAEALKCGAVSVSTTKKGRGKHFHTFYFYCSHGTVSSLVGEVLRLVVHDTAFTKGFVDRHNKCILKHLLAEFSLFVLNV